MKARWFQLSSTEIQLCLTTDGKTSGLTGPFMVEIAVPYRTGETDRHHQLRVERLLEDLNYGLE